MVYLNDDLRGEPALWADLHVAADVIVRKFKLKVEAALDVDYARVGAGPTVHPTAKNTIRPHVSNHVRFL